MELIDQITTDKKPSKKWKDIHLGRAFEVSPLPLQLRDNVFCMGSCFARNIRLALETNNIHCQPNYKKLENLNVNRGGSTRIDDLHFKVFHLNHYTPLSILQELRRSVKSAGLQPAINLPKDLPDPSDFIVKSNLKNEDSTKPIFHDPARRLVYAEEADALEEINEAISIVIAKGMLNASAFIITLGLIEQFFKELTDSRKLWFNQHLTYGGMRPHRETQLSSGSLFLTADVVKSTLNDIIQTIRAISSAPILFTVSPVPLQRTVRKGMNIIEANWLSKATLLVATREVAEENSGKDVYYYPSFEIVASYGQKAFQPRDSRHVEDRTVDEITKAFISCTQK